MTEAAAFSSAAQKDSFTELGVERFKVVATFDKDTCDVCGALDGEVFKMADYQIGLTAPPFHPWCRCCTCPYYADMEKLGERWTRNPDGTTAKVPPDMTFDEWKRKFVEFDSDSELTATTSGGIIKLTDVEQRALNEYISSGAYKINPLLREGQPLTAEMQKLVSDLDAALEELPIYVGTVYRSLDSSMMNTETFWAEHIPGRIVRYPAYTSSGTVVYDGTMDIQVIIQSKSAHDLRKFNPGEQEILFPRNSEFIVTRREGSTLWLEEI